MNREWLIIPEYSNIEDSLRLAEQYGAAFEYNDFFVPGVYEDEAEIKRRIAFYKGCARDRSRDTLHGVFLDIAIHSQDKAISEYSCRRMEQSVAITQELGLRGVVFHSGLIRGFKLQSYLEHWYETQEALMRSLLEKYPSITIYLENSFEAEPDCLVELKKRLRDQDRFMLCMDYAHASLGSIAIEDWVSTMAQYVGHMHVNDNDLQEDLHLAPGEGSIDFKQFKELLLKNNVDTPVLLEVTGAKKQCQALDFMNKL